MKVHACSVVYKFHTPFETQDIEFFEALTKSDIHANDRESMTILVSFSVSILLAKSYLTSLLLRILEYIIFRNHVLTWLNLE